MTKVSDKIYKEKFMREAIRLSVENAKKGGGPFGAIIVKGNIIIGRGVNNVTKSNDPTAHAEIAAIRNASKNTGNFSLKGSVIYTSCEPCPMCLSAIYWADIDRIYFGNTRKDAAKIGFKDDHIYSELRKPLSKRKVRISCHLRDEALMAFEIWDMLEDKIEYGMLK